MKGVTILGTDTGVGKTLVSCCLLRALSFRGWKPLPLKPVETGLSSGSSDARRLLDTAGLSSWPESVISKYRFQAPVAPSLAAKWAGVEISREDLLSVPNPFLNEFNFLVVETAGGLLSPLYPGFSSLDLAISFGFPVLLVSRNGLGTVNLTALALHEIQGKPVSLLGVVLSTVNETPSPDQPFNASLIESCTGMVPLGSLPYIEDWSTANLLPFALKIFPESLFPIFANEPLHSRLVSEK